MNEKMFREQKIVTHEQEEKPIAELIQQEKHELELSQGLFASLSRRLMNKYGVGLATVITIITGATNLSEGQVHEMLKESQKTERLLKNSDNYKNPETEKQIDKSFYAEVEKANFEYFMKKERQEICYTSTTQEDEYFSVKSDNHAILLHFPDTEITLDSAKLATDAIRSSLFQANNNNERIIIAYQNQKEKNLNNCIIKSIDKNNNEHSVNLDKIIKEKVYLKNIVSYQDDIVACGTTESESGFLVFLNDDLEVVRQELTKDTKMLGIYEASSRNRSQSEPITHQTIKDNSGQKIETIKNSHGTEKILNSGSEVHDIGKNIAVINYDKRGATVTIFDSELIEINKILFQSADQSMIFHPNKDGFDIFIERIIQESPKQKSEFRGVRYDSEGNFKKTEILQTDY